MTESRSRTSFSSMLSGFEAFLDVMADVYE